MRTLPSLATLIAYVVEHACVGAQMLKWLVQELSQLLEPAVFQQDIAIMESDSPYAARAVLFQHASDCFKGTI